MSKNIIKSPLIFSFVHCFSLTTIFCSALEAIEVENLPIASFVPGGVAVIQIEPIGERANYNGQKVMLVNYSESQFAVIGIPLNTIPGIKNLQVKHPSCSSSNYDFTVKEKKYQEQSYKFMVLRLIDHRSYVYSYLQHFFCAGAGSAGAGSTGAGSAGGGNGGVNGVVTRW